VTGFFQSFRKLSLKKNGSTDVTAIDLFNYGAADLWFKVEEVFISSGGVLVMSETGDTKDVDTFLSRVLNLNEE